MASGFHYSIGGAPTNPADIFFREFTLSANTTLVWPFAAQDSVNVAARLMLVNVSTPSLQLFMPPANQAPVGYTAIICNLGSVSFIIYDNNGGVITTLNPGDVKYLAVRTATTPAGTWYVITFGSGTSAANAAALSGLGLTPIASTLNANFPFAAVTNGQLISVGDRAGGRVWTSGTGILNFDASTTLTNGWWVMIKNLGSGPLTLTPFVGDTIDGASSQILNSGDSCFVLCSGTFLYTVGIGRITTTTDTRISKSVSGSSDVVLTSGEAANDIINFTGTLTANINVIFPTNVKNFFISNNTSGAFTLTCKTASGTGIQVVQGNAAILTCDGTNIIISQSTLSGTVTSVTAGTGLTGGTITGSGTIALASTGVGSGTYGDGTHFPIFTVNPQGQLTSSGQISLGTAAFKNLGSVVVDDGSGNLTINTSVITGNMISGSAAMPNGVTATTQGAGDSSTKLATTAFVNGTALTLANGSTAATQASNDSSTKLATTAFVNPANLKSTNGYVKLPCGIIFQWGIAVNVVNSVNVTFPLLFPTGVVNINGSSSSNNNANFYTSGWSASGFVANTGSAGTFDLAWFAVGY